MRDRIRKVLLTVGLPSLPDSADAPLFDYEMDSLIEVTLALELEREFGVKIYGQPLEKRALASMQSIEELLVRLGVTGR